MAAGSAFVLLAIAAVDLAVAGRWLDLALLAFGITLLVAAQLLQIKSRRDVAASVASPSQDHGDLPSPRA